VALATIDCAYRMTVADRRAGDVGFCVSVVCSEVDGKNYDLYDCDGDDNPVRRRIRVSGCFSDAFLDADLADAPLIFWLWGNVNCDPGHYRRLLVGCGRLLHQVMIAVADHGLSGVPIAGIVLDKAAARLGLNNVECTPIAAFVSGKSD
jgi:hypothetical protein